MTEVRREPRLPPKETPFLEADGRTISKAWYRYLQGERGYSDNVNSGATAAALAAEQARADAAAAQAAADAATQGVADVQAGVAAGTITFSASFSPFSAIGTRLGTGSVTTNSVTVTPTGGTAPYDITVAYLSGDAGFSASNPSDTGVASLSTTFTGSITALGQDKSAIWRATITDAALDSITVTAGVAIAEIS